MKFSFAFGSICKLFSVVCSHLLGFTGSNVSVSLRNVEFNSENFISDHLDIGGSLFVSASVSMHRWSSLQNFAIRLLYDRRKEKETIINSHKAVLKSWHLTVCVCHNLNSLWNYASDIINSYEKWGHSRGFVCELLSIRGVSVCNL